MAHAARTVVIMAALILAGLSAPAKADFSVCNKTADKVTVAVGYINSQGFVSEGWWDLSPCGGCGLLVKSSETTDPHNVFIYAHAGDRVWEGSSPFCTTGNAFKIVGKQNCAARGFREKRFEHLTPERVNHTLNLTGQSSSGRHCGTTRREEPTRKEPPVIIDRPE